MRPVLIPEPHKLGVVGAVCHPSHQEVEAEDLKVKVKVILDYTGRSAWAT